VITSHSRSNAADRENLIVRYNAAIEICRRFQGTLDEEFTPIPTVLLQATWRRCFFLRTSPAGFGQTALPTLARRKMGRAPSVTFSPSEDCKRRIPLPLPGCREWFHWRVDWL
jgi:hypothetical protein